MEKLNEIGKAIGFVIGCVIVLVGFVLVLGAAILIIKFVYHAIGG